MLPQEIWSMIFRWLPLDQLYPSCFLICKQLHNAVLSDASWELRCREDLGVTAKPQDIPTWVALYQGNTRHTCFFFSLVKTFNLKRHVIDIASVQWDLNSYTRCPSEREDLKAALQGKDIKFSMSAHRESKEDIQEILHLTKTIFAWNCPKS